MIASLPMYDRPETADANDALWQNIRTRLDFEAPAQLTRGGDLWAQWRSPDLVLSQTCGYPYRARLHDAVTLIGAPVHDLPGCPPGHYNSVLIVRKDDPRNDPAAFAAARFAFNEPMSQSGWAGPQNDAAARGFRYTNPVQTGGHAFSARAVADGKADIAGIDALTWLLIKRHDSFARDLRVIAETKPTPILPYISAAGRDADMIARAVEDAVDALPAHHRDALALTGFTRIAAAHYLAVPNPASPDENTAVLS